MVFWIPAFSGMTRFATTDDTARRSSLFNLLYASVICRVNEKPPGSITLDLNLFFLVMLHTLLPSWCLSPDHLEFQKGKNEA